MRSGCFTLRDPRCGLLGGRGSKGRDRAGGVPDTSQRSRRPPRMKRASGSSWAAKREITGTLETKMRATVDLCSWLWKGRWSDRPSRRGGSLVSPGNSHQSLPFPPSIFEHHDGRSKRSSHCLGSSLLLVTATSAQQSGPIGSFGRESVSGREPEKTTMLPSFTILTNIGPLGSSMQKQVP